ncbi:hypothetical protein Taro_022376, partial [Colocasia esculenta]|nr:hypothetical protein [Colocasia esculenta]
MVGTEASVICRALLAGSGLRGWFYLWALDLVEVLGGRTCSETFVLTWLLGVSRGDTWLFFPNLVEVRDVGACVVRLWSHVAALVFRELYCLGRVVLLPLVGVPSTLAGKGL